MSDELPVLPLYYNLAPLPFTDNLVGPNRSAPGSTTYGNLSQWQWVR